MFAEAEVELPNGRRHAHARAGRRRGRRAAIERNRGEIDVAPLPLRVGTLFASLAPELAGRVARRMGADDIARQMAAGQRDKR